MVGVPKATHVHIDAWVADDDQADLSPARGTQLQDMFKGLRVLVANRNDRFRCDGSENVDQDIHAAFVPDKRFTLPPDGVVGASHHRCKLDRHRGRKGELLNHRNGP